MIVYKNILQQLKSRGITTYVILKENLISQKTLTAIRHNKPINTKTVNTLCSLLNCQPGDIMEYVEDPAEE